jgi:LuxR family maltose regulon positive regulatory protein
LASVRSWLDALPTDVIERDPQLSSEYAWSLMRGGYAARSRPFTEAAEKQWRAAGDDVGIGRVLILRALEDFFLHNNNRGIERCRQSLALLPEELVDDRARLFGVLGYLLSQQGELMEAEAALLRCRLLAREVGNLSLQLIEMNGSGLYLYHHGELSEAETLFQRVIATGDEWHDLPVVYAHLLLGDLYLEQYRLDLAEQSLERALELADRLSVRLHPIRIHHLLGEIAWARHDSETALAEIERSIAVAGPDGFGIEARHTRAQLARIWMMQGKHNLARTWANELDLNFDQPPELAYANEYLVALEFHARDGRAGRALVSLDLAIAHAREKGFRHHLLSMLILKSVLLTSQGKAKESTAALSSAIDIGAGSRYVRPFIAFGNELEDHLQELSFTSTHARYIRHLLEQIRSDRQRGAPSAELENPLSKRQTEIMQLVAAGYSNRDIADQLFISEQTVKKHLSTTFIRLEVSSRTQAIDACRRLDIL